MKVWRGVAVIVLAAASIPGAAAARAAEPELVIADRGACRAAVIVAPGASGWERRAAEDLVRYIGRMCGARPLLADTASSADAALRGGRPVIVVGRRALELQPDLRAALRRTARPAPVLRADAMVLRRVGNRVYAAGSNDDSHYYAAVALLKRWGCRWYLPTDFGECIPHRARLTIGALDTAYAPPFEVRRYWNSWNGDTTGRPEFMRRNGMNDAYVPSGHAVGQYMRDLVPPGKTLFNVPIAEEATAAHVAKQIAPAYAAGTDISLAMEDGVYETSSPIDRELIALQFDQSFMTPAVTDAFMTFYNAVAETLQRQYPQSKARLGFLAYSNMTMPPVRVKKAARSLVAYLAPIDVDPIHGMDDVRSPMRRNLRRVVEGWSRVMDGRVVIYDYDQSMMVWRDIPNPSHQAFRQDVKHLARAGILGVDTESRGAYATTFLNMAIRGALMWDPNTDVDALLAEFYPKFYGPAAAPMQRYWSAIYRAWQETEVTEHEYFVLPAIYTPSLITSLRGDLEAAEAAVRTMLKSRPAPTAEDRVLQDRMRFTRMVFDIMEACVEMTRLAATECDYPAAVKAGEPALKTREALTDMNGIFTTYRHMPETGPPWWPGEVALFREIAALQDGTTGTLVQRMPLEWAFRRDARNVGLDAKWYLQEPDMTWWSASVYPWAPARRKQNPGTWEMLRSDLYLQAQGAATADYTSWTGYGWYRTTVDVNGGAAGGPIHLRFPGLFNECWLYVNGEMVAHRPFPTLWWYSDYRFDWDVDLAGKLKPGANTFVLRINNPHHTGGMFRRPFLYRPK